MMNQRQAVATASSYYHQHPHQRRSSGSGSGSGHHHLIQISASSAPSPFHPHPAQHYHESAHGPLVYRPLQLPLAGPVPVPVSSNHPQQTQQHHSVPLPQRSVEQPPQLPSPAVVGARPYQHSTFRHPQATARLHCTRAQTRQRQHSAMAYDQQNDQAAAEELAKMQELSRDYEPEVTGPLVGQRQPSSAITNEYASADPIYQAKTTTLPQRYSHYRTVRGDGKCGWRAVGFGYFEALVHHGDSNTILMEEARLRSLSNVIVQAGFDAMLVEDFSDMTFDLLRNIMEAMTQGNASEVLEQAFNDDTTQNYIITHLRTLTAAWMKTHHENYAPFLLGTTVDQYCKDQIEPVGAEIDHVGLVALKDVFVSPASLSLEVLYLDRSEGDQVTMHRYDPVAGGGYTIGSIRLLYRPGHYDLLYKLEDLPAPPPPPPAAVPTYLQFATQNYETVQDLGVSDFMANIPGMSYASLSSSSWMSSSYGSGSEFFGTPAPAPSCAPAVPTPAAPAPRPQIESKPVYVSSSTPTQTVPPPTQIPHELATRTSVPQHTIGHPDFQHQLSGGPFRPSAWQLEPDFVHATSQMPFQTSIFRNSHFNTAHFLNPDFQPEQWDPDDEYATASNSSKSSRHKSSG